MQRLGALNPQHRHPPSTVVISCLLELWGSHFWGLHGIFQEEWDVDTGLSGMCPFFHAGWHGSLTPLLHFSSAQVLCSQ